MFPQKHINPQLFDLPSIHAAITHAAVTCPPDTLPLAATGTNVGELVTRILASATNLAQEGHTPCKRLKHAC